MGVLEDVYDFLVHPVSSYWDIWGTLTVWTVVFHVFFYFLCGFVLWRNFVKKWAFLYPGVTSCVGFIIGSCGSMVFGSLIAGIYVTAGVDLPRYSGAFWGLAQLFFYMIFVAYA